jgi:hypothetical protein
MTAEPLTPEEEAALRADLAKYPNPYKGTHDTVNYARRLLATLDDARSIEGLHFHDVDGVELWFDGVGGKPVGGPA